MIKIIVRIFGLESIQCKLMEFPTTDMTESTTSTSVSKDYLRLVEFKRALDSHWKEDKIGYGVEKATSIYIPKC